MEKIHTAIIQEEPNINIWADNTTVYVKETLDLVSILAKRTNVCKNVGCGCTDRDCILDYEKE